MLQAQLRIAQLFCVATHVGVKQAVLINAAHLSGQSARKPLVLDAERFAADLIEKLEPAEHVTA